jgi:hypothetical protein|nr:MAG TPA: RNA ligase 2 [Caudoviricetes sp.]
MNLKRVSIPHLENLTDDQFEAVLNAEKIDLHLKVDGAGIRFWKEDGKFVMGTSRVARIESARQFIDHNPRSMRCHAYAKLFHTLEDSLVVKSLPENVTVIAEVLYKPLGYKDGMNHVYVKVPYRIINDLAIAVIDIVESDSMMPVDEHTYHTIMMDMIRAAGGEHILMFSTGLFSIDSELLPTITDRAELRNDLLFLAEKDAFWTLLGDMNEGIVCRAGDIVFKITTDEYRELRKQK